MDGAWTGAAERSHLHSLLRRCAELHRPKRKYEGNNRSKRPHELTDYGLYPPASMVPCIAIGSGGSPNWSMILFSHPGFGGVTRSQRGPTFRIPIWQAHWIIVSEYSFGHVGWAANSDAVSPWVSNLAHALSVLDCHRASVQGSANFTHVGKCGVKIREAPIDYGTGSSA